ncbi:LOW QUALITY PROTEIN: uncharacterized protein LOC114935656, partial [Nylanderia fulva]|uniref:LOW QUALITY PROTEIN: uncharacterized protein LOC114935656 n=1 Tax=Nylanderia fulva TaxID=613905 RepID=UPI0010FAE7A3
MDLFAVKKNWIQLSEHEIVNIVLKITKCKVSSTCEMVDCITICNSACITCIWCILFSVCFPRFSKNLKKVDSSECCIRKKSNLKHQKAHTRDFSRCVKADLVRARRFNDCSCFERDHEDRREHRSREKKCDRALGERRNACRCLKKDRKISPIYKRPVKHSNSYSKSDRSLSKKNSNTILEADKSEYDQ